MATRSEAEAAIRAWRRMGLAQIELALRTDVAEDAISKIIHQPGYTRSEKVYQRICDAVDGERHGRIDALEMTVVSLCETTPRVFDERTTSTIVKNVKAAMKQPCGGAAVVLPEGIKGAMLNVRDGGSGLVLLVLPTADDKERIRATIHELDHLKAYLSQWLPADDFTPPRSSW